MKNKKNKTTKTTKTTKATKTTKTTEETRAILVDIINKNEILRFMANVGIMLSNVITTTIYTAFDELKFEIEYFGYSKLNRFSIERE